MGPRDQLPGRTSDGVEITGRWLFSLHSEKYIYVSLPVHLSMVLLIIFLLFWNLTESSWFQIRKKIVTTISFDSMCKETKIQFS